jgi:hypothetical protein
LPNEIQVLSGTHHIAALGKSGHCTVTLHATVKVFNWLTMASKLLQMWPGIFSIPVPLFQNFWGVPQLSLSKPFVQVSQISLEPGWVLNNSSSISSLFLLLSNYPFYFVFWQLVEILPVQIFNWTFTKLSKEKTGISPNEQYLE